MATLTCNKCNKVFEHNKRGRRPNSCEPCRSMLNLSVLASKTDAAPIQKERINSPVEKVYDKLYLQKISEIANKREINPRIAMTYAEAKKDDLILKDMTELEYAAFISGRDPTRSGIAEQAQLEILSKIDPSIKSLPNTGLKCIRIPRIGSNIRYGLPKEEGPNNTKSFDAIQETETNIVLYMLKAIDLGSFSKSKNGGGQDSTKAEIDTMCSLANERSFTMNNKPVIIKILVDGRLSSDIVSLYNHATNKALVSSCDTLYKEKYAS